MTRDYYLKKKIFKQRNSRKNKISQTRECYAVRFHRETEQKRLKTGMANQKQQQEQRTILIERSWQNADCSKDHRTTESMSWKNVSTSTVKKRLCEIGLYSRISISKPLLRKQINGKRIEGAKTHKNWTTEQRNEILWTDASPKRRVFVRHSVGERGATPCKTPIVKHGGGFVMVGNFLRDKTLTAPNITAQLNQCHEKMCHHPLWKKTLWNWLI